MSETAFLLLDVLLLLFAVVNAVAVVAVRSLFAATMLFGFYSLLMALIWQNMDAVDVSFTEASVGAGISTVLLLGAVLLVGRNERERPGPRINWTALAVVTLTGAALVYGSLSFRPFGDPAAPIHQLRANRYLSESVGHVPYAGTVVVVPDGPDRPVLSAELQAVPGSHHPPDDALDAAKTDDHTYHDDWHGHVPNTVTAVLAGYRGFDTLLETAVIFTAGMSLVLLLRRRREATEIDLPKEAEVQR